MSCDRSIISFNVDTRELLNVDKENVNNVYAFSELIRADYNATIDGSTDPVRRRAGSTRGTSELGRRLNFRCLPTGAGGTTWAGGLRVRHSDRSDWTGVPRVSVTCASRFKSTARRIRSISTSSRSRRPR